MAREVFGARGIIGLHAVPDVGTVYELMEESTFASALGTCIHGSHEVHWR